MLELYLLQKVFFPLLTLECGNATPHSFKTTGRGEGPEMKIAASLCSPSSWVCDTCSLVHRCLIFFSSLALLLGRCSHVLCMCVCGAAFRQNCLQRWEFFYHAKFNWMQNGCTWRRCEEVEELVAQCIQVWETSAEKIGSAVLPGGSVNISMLCRLRRNI